MSFHLLMGMQISFVSFFSCLANRTSRYQKIDASWLVNQLHAPYIQCAVGELYTVMHNQKSHLEIPTSVRPIPQF